jgi:hypothetical protein
MDRRFSDRAVFHYVTAMPRHQLDKSNSVYGAYTLARGRLTFTTGDAAMIQRLQLDQVAGRISTLWLHTPEGIKDVRGCIDSVKLVSEGRRPQCWEVTLSER